jgi:hypothetical protein
VCRSPRLQSIHLRNTQRRSRVNQVRVSDEGIGVHDRLNRGAVIPSDTRQGLAPLHVVIIPACPGNRRRRVRSRCRRWRAGRWRRIRPHKLRRADRTSRNVVPRRIRNGQPLINVHVIGPRNVVHSSDGPRRNLIATANAIQRFAGLHRVVA